MQMLHILCSSKRSHPANNSLAQREGGGWHVEWKASDLLLVLLGNSGRAGVATSVHTMLAQNVIPIFRQQINRV